MSDVCREDTKSGIYHECHDPNNCLSQSVQIIGKPLSLVFAFNLQCSCLSKATTVVMLYLSMWLDASLIFAVDLGSFFVGLTLFLPVPRNAVNLCVFFKPFITRINSNGLSIFSWLRFLLIFFVLISYYNSGVPRVSNYFLKLHISRRRQRHTLNFFVKIETFFLFIYMNTF